MRATLDELICVNMSSQSKVNTEYCISISLQTPRGDKGKGISRETVTGCCLLVFPHKIFFNWENFVKHL